MGWSAGRHVDHLCGWQVSPWPAREVTDQSWNFHTECFQTKVLESSVWKPPNFQQVPQKRVHLEPALRVSSFRTVYNGAGPI